LIVEDTESKRNLIHIKGAKGKKNRYSVFSLAALGELKKYWKQCKPNRWLFPRAKIDRHISTRTVETIRHSFATYY
jgi:integrase